MIAPTVTAPLFETDAYKLGHKDQYPEGTEYVYSNFTNRGSRLPEVTSVVHFGLQAFIERYCMEAFEPFFEADEDFVAQEYEDVVTSILGPNNIGSDHIRALHRKGYLPLKFCAVPEGTLVPLRVPSFTVENTDPEFFWLTNYIETVLSASVWHPSTTATIAHEYRLLLDAWAEKTGGDPLFVPWQGHDFSYRGLPGTDAAAASGAGHLLSFNGSDSLASLAWIDGYYGSWRGDPILGSVPATEHSVMCAGGMDDELGTYERLLNTYPSGIVSIVSDTWDLWRVLTEHLPTLKDKILARDGKVVIRPDSGNPVDILTGTVSFEGSGHGEEWYAGWSKNEGATSAEIGVVELLWNTFGGTVNEKGYKVLDSHIGTIYGDSITLERADEICRRLEAKGFASTNVVFGIGSYTYQYVTRDTFGSAIKATWVQINGEGKAIQKSPVTDSGLKKSATGRLAVIEKDGVLTLVENATPYDELESELRTTWVDGHFTIHQSFDSVRDVLADSGVKLVLP